MKKIVLIIAKIAHKIFDKEKVDTISFLLNGSWAVEQWKERDRLLADGYVQTKHDWNEYDEYSTYEYSKPIEDFKYYDMVLKMFNK